MKKAILYLSMLATMTASTGAMAEKYYYKQRLDGVKAEVNQEESDNQEELDNQAMCLNQAVNMKTEWENFGILYNKSSSYVKDSVYGVIFKPEISSGSPIIYAGGDVSERLVSEDESITAIMTEKLLKGEARNYFQVGETYRMRIYKEGGKRGESSNANLYALYTEKKNEIEEKTENYDWCIENGYPVSG